ncbi:MAG: alkaline phosphatase family protein [Balneolales bacterium]|nr:alkaline phosphatase family protein [Balneolales bacterium]
MILATYFFRRSSFLLSAVFAAFLILSGCSGTDSRDSNRVIVVSFDALNEEILRSTLSPDEVPNLYRFFNNGSCAEFAQTAFPSLTASSHASIWTGAFGNITGITANSQHVLPRSENTINDRHSGFSYDGLMAEPFWVTAGKNGFRAVGHQVTQAPFAGGFPTENGESRRAEQQEFLNNDAIAVFNGYNRQVLRDTVIRMEDAESDDISAWSDISDLGDLMQPIAVRWQNDAGSIYALLTGEDSYNSMLISRSRSVNDAVRVDLHDAESEPFHDRPLARFFSEPMEVVLDEDSPLERGWLRFRLFEMEADGSGFMLYHPAMHISEANLDEAQLAYHNAVKGWFGNSSMRMYTGGGLGTPFWEGGDGTAEQRYLETAELLTLVFNAGSEWLWRNNQPHLMADYFPLPDTIDHNILGFMETSFPGYDAELANKASELRTAGWQLADLRLGLLLSLAEESNGSVFLTGDHGMRTSWMQFYPNTVLRNAGLLVLDERGNPDLSQTKALSPNGYWITVNTTDWKDGIVNPDELDSVLDQIEEALLAATGADGQQVIRRVYRAADYADELGLGGPAGGDIYWNIAEGYRTTGFMRSSDVTAEARLWSTHGYDSTDPDMYTAFCAYGPSFPAFRFQSVKTIDIAPTAGEYVGFGKPADASGQSVLHLMRP